MRTNPTHLGSGTRTRYKYQGQLESFSCTPDTETSAAAARHALAEPRPSTRSTSRDGHIPKGLRPYSSTMFRTPLNRTWLNFYDQRSRFRVSGILLCYFLAIGDRRAALAAFLYPCRSTEVQSFGQSCGTYPSLSLAPEDTGPSGLPSKRTCRKLIAVACSGNHVRSQLEDDQTRHNLVGTFIDSLPPDRSESMLVSVCSTSSRGGTTQQCLAAVEDRLVEFVDWDSRVSYSLVYQLFCIPDVRGDRLDQEI